MDDLGNDVNMGTNAGGHKIGGGFFQGGSGDYGDFRRNFLGPFRFVANPIVYFVRKVNFIVLIPVFTICVLFLSGIKDSGFMQDLLDFLSKNLAMLQGYAYVCAKILPNIPGFFECFK